jgi:predicted DNA-binding transcriptional regulator YafY
VSKTRIYNDIQALREASIPVRRHGRGYKLAEGFFMPPLSLTLREAASLVLPMEFFLCAMPRSRDTLAARQKLLACLAPDVRKRAELLHRRIRATSLLDGTKSHVLEQLLQAIAEQRRVELIGAPDGPRHETALTWFLFDPYRIVYDRGAWYISGYAVSHREVRSFRTTDIEAVKPTPLHFAYPEGTLVDGEPPSASPSS